MTPRRLASVLLLCLAASAAAAQPADPAAPRDGTVYAGSAAGAEGSLTFMAGDASLVLRTKEPASLPQQAALLSGLLRQVLAEHPDLPRLSLFLVDREAIVERLATALAACKGWNGDSGKPVHGDVRRVIVDTVNDRDLAAEIARVFEAAGYTLRAQGAAMITEARLAAHGGKLLPTDVAYLAFIAERGATGGGGQSWRTRRFHHSIC